ncbi:MAG: ABC transporter permease [Candidatus Bathyarchaeales archaeon]
MNPLIRYLSRRFFFFLITFFTFLLIIFTLPRAIPGNPLAQILYSMFQQAQTNPELIQAVYKQLMEEFGIGKPLHIQLLEFFIRLLHGDLGTSIAFYPRKVTELVFIYLPYTLGLLIPATLVSWIIGNLLGALAAYKRKSIIDNALLPIFLTLSQTPYYWLAMILVYVFAVTFRLFPVGGAYSETLVPAFTITFVTDFLYHYQLPFFSIVLAAMGGWAIGMRSMVIYELNADYVSYAESLGLSDNKILRYVFKNSMLPQITGLALNLGTIAGGSLITELVFNYPGTGYLLFRALSTLDYPLIQGTFIILISTLLLANLIVDLVYSYIDPRIRTGYTQ